MPVPERQCLASQGCGAEGAARQLAGLDVAKGAAGLLRWWGGTVSGAIACSGDQGGMTPPMKSLLSLAGFEEVGDQVAEAPAFKVRPLLQVLDEMPRQCGGHPLRSASEQICSMRQLGRR